MPKATRDHGGPVQRGSPGARGTQGRQQQSPLVESVLSLQRTSGNRAVGLLLAQRRGVTDAPPVVAQRDDRPDTRMLDRPGAQWRFGPITKHKSVQNEFSSYVYWVKQVERAYGPDKQSVLQRLRRLYYSGYSGKGEYDRVISDQGYAGAGPPLDARMIGTAVLDRLYETNVLRHPNGRLIDVSHVLAALDVKTAGVTFKAAGAEVVYSVKWLGVVTWAGDLASWIVKYIKEDRARGEAGPRPTDSHLAAAQKVNLLSDMDGQILAQENVGPSKLEHVKAEGRPIRDANVGTELSMPVSAILEQYYGTDIGTAGQPPKSKGRFPAFVRIATPPIPHRNWTAEGSGPVTLAAEAPDAIYDAIYNTARMFAVESSSSSYGTVGTEVLDQYRPHFRGAARRFTQFLATGLATGDAPWPGTNP